MEVYNVLLPPLATDNPSEWDARMAGWAEVKRGALVLDEFNLLTIKALYVTGVIVNNCRSVSLLLAPPNLPEVTFYTAYAAAAATIELLGRCLKGNPNEFGSSEDLFAGFSWLGLHQHEQIYERESKQVLVKTPMADYTAQNLVALRNFAAHGQGVMQPKEDPEKKKNKKKNRENKKAVVDTSGPSDPDPKQPPETYFDYGVLTDMAALLGQGVGAWLDQLQTSPSLSRSLLDANVTPYRNRPVFDGLWQMQGGRAFPDSVAAFLASQDWSVKRRNLGVQND